MLICIKNVRTVDKTTCNVFLLFKLSKTKSFRGIGDGIIEFNKTDPDVLSIFPNVHMNKVKAGGYAYISKLFV